MTPSPGFCVPKLCNGSVTEDVQNAILQSAASDIIILSVTIVTDRIRRKLI